MKVEKVIDVRLCSIPRGTPPNDAGTIGHLRRGRRGLPTRPSLCDQQDLWRRSGPDSAWDEADKVLQSMVTIFRSRLYPKTARSLSRRTVKTLQSEDVTLT